MKYMYVSSLKVTQSRQGKRKREVIMYNTIGDEVLYMCIHIYNVTDIM